MEKLEQSEVELRRVTQDTILALTRAIERRDIETAHHIERVSLYATVLATRLGLTHHECEMIREASPMHDVGKVGIPDGILLKPGPVTAAEFSVIKQHVSLGQLDPGALAAALAPPRGGRRRDPPRALGR